MEDAATTMVHAFIMSQVDYCSSVLHRVSAANVQSLQKVPMLQLKSCCISGSLTTSPLTFEIDYIGCSFSRELNTKCESWCTSVCIKLHQHTSLHCAHWCLISQSCSLCSTACGDLVVPHSRTTRYGQRCFAVSGPILWNSLPLSVRDPSLTPTQFCALLKTMPFCRAYGTLT